jgi:hypothetical protein
VGEDGNFTAHPRSAIVTRVRHAGARA